MADDGEWARKGASIDGPTAERQYGVTREFILRGVRAGKLESRKGSAWGTPYLRVLRSELEIYIATELGSVETEKLRVQVRALMNEKARLEKERATLVAERAALEAKSPRS
jgi:hypothetical protein